MGRLAGFKVREVTRKLTTLGFQFYRHGAGSHDIWHNPKTGAFTTIPNHPGDLPEGTLRAILKQTGVSVSDFLAA
jgi:predicted RNA binding protein YcfA (HicA-like mRNA interferase family)